MAVPRPSTRRGLQEPASLHLQPTAEGIFERPSTRGKGYLNEKQQRDSISLSTTASAALNRPTTRHGPQQQQHQQTTRNAHQQQDRKQLAHNSTSYNATHASAVHKAAGYAAAQRNGPSTAQHLQEHPSQASISLSDLDGLSSSSLSVGASSINIIGCNDQGSPMPGSKAAAVQRKAGVPANAGPTQQKQTTAQREIWERPSSRQQQHTNPAAVHRPAPTAAVPATVPATVEMEASNISMSELSGMSSSFLSVQGSGVEIVYSETDIQQEVTLRPAQQQQQQQLHQQAQTQAAIATRPAAAAPAAAMSAATCPASSQAVHDSNVALIADDSAISGEIEFSNSTNSIVAAATAQQASRTSATPAAATTAAVRARRAASTNLRWTHDSSSSFGSAEIDFVTSQTEQAAAAQPAKQPSAAAAAAAVKLASQPVVATSAGRQLQLQEQDAADATEQLFATLAVVPAVQPLDSSSSSDGSQSRRSSNRGSSKRSRKPSKAQTLDTALGGTSDLQRTVQNDTSSLMAGLEQLHGTLQVVKARHSSSSGSGSSSGDESSERGSRQQQQRRIRSSRRMSWRRTSSSRVNSMLIRHSLINSSSSSGMAAGTSSSLQDGHQHQTEAMPAQAAAAAAAAAAETVALLGSLHVVVQQRDLSTSSSEVSTQSSLDASMSDIAGQRHAGAAGTGGQAQQQQQICSHDSKLAQRISSNAAQQPMVATAGSKTGDSSSSQLASCDINELLRRRSLSQQASKTKKASAVTHNQSRQKKRSIALQVGSNNDKATQVVFDQQRRILWDGGCSLSLQQHQQQPCQQGSYWHGRRRPQISSLADIAANLGQPGVCDLRSQARVPSAVADASYPPCDINTLQHRSACNVTDQGAGYHSRSGYLGFGGTINSCWSVLSASLQQFRAAALLDQLEGLLRTAASAAGQPGQQQQQQPVPAHGAAAQHAPHNNSQCYAAQQTVPVQQPSAGPAACPAAVSAQAVGADAGWFSIPVGGTNTDFHSRTVQHKADAAGPQQQQQHNTMAAGWISLPSLPARGAASAAPVHDADKEHVAPPGPDAGWFSVPVSSVISGSNHAATAAVAPHAAPVAEEGWLSLPMPASIAATADTAAAAQNTELQHRPQVEIHSHSVHAVQQHKMQEAATASGPDACWLTLPVTGASSSTTSTATAPSMAAQAAAVGDAQSGRDKGLINLPDSSVSKARNAADNTAVDVAASETQPADDAGWFSLPVAGISTSAMQPPPQPQQHQNSVAVEETSAGWLSLPVPGRAVSETPLACAAVVAAAAAEAADSGGGFQDTGVRADSDKQQTVDAHAPASSATYSSSFESAAAVPTAATAEPAGLGTDTASAVGYSNTFESASSPTTSMPAAMYAPVNTTAAAAAVTTSLELSVDACSVSSIHTDAWAATQHSSDAASRGSHAVTGLLEDCGATGTPAKLVNVGAAIAAAGVPAEQPIHHIAAQQQQQQQGEGPKPPTSVGTFSRYIAYLDAAAAQGVVPPGLTAATARALRDNLLQAAASATQQQQYALQQKTAVGGGCGSVLGGSSLCYEDMVSSACLDGFMGSSLAHIRRKLAVKPGVRQAWNETGSCGELHSKPVPVAHDAAVHAGSAAKSNAAPKHGSNLESAMSWQGSFQSSDSSRTRPNSSGWMGVPAGRHLTGGYQYTTLEDTLAFIMRHRQRISF